MHTTGVRRPLVLLAVSGLTATGLIAGAGAVRAVPRHAEQRRSPAAKTYTDAGLGGVSVAPKSSTAWATGEKAGDTADTTFVMKRVKGKWHAVPAKVTQHQGIDPIAAASTKDIWVGGTTFGTDSARTPLLEHSTGGVFTPVKTTLPAGSIVDLAATSPTNVWALGSRPSGGAFVAYLKGKTWHLDRKVKTASTFEPEAISTSSSKEVWVVGNAYDERTDSSTPYAIHLSGHHTTPRVMVVNAPVDTLISGVATSGPHNAWFVGSSEDDTTSPSLDFGFAAHWNGSTQQPMIVDQPYDNIKLSSVAAFGKHAIVTGLGRYGDSDAPTFVQRSFTMTNHGKHFRTVPIANQGASDQLNRVALNSKTAVAVGFFLHTSDGVSSSGPPFPLIEGFSNGKWRFEKSAGLNP